MVGSWTVTVHAIRPFTIHGDLYYELHVTKDTDDNVLAIRVPEHACSEPLTVSDRVDLTFLMGQVTAVKKLPTTHPPQSG
jgi:hypothetical protein